MGRAVTDSEGLRGGQGLSGAFFRSVSAICLGLFPGLGLPGVLWGQDLVLDPITVTVPRAERDPMQVPQAVTVLESDAIRLGRQGLQLDESLNRVPGLFMQNRYNFAQNLRISMRGFGARAPFGIRGIRLYVDGIPETLPDGQSQVDAIDLTSADRIEVIRGPSSALYGNASGGVIQVTTLDDRDAPHLEARSMAGSHGFRRIGLRGGGETGAWNAQVSAWDSRYDGYRRQSASEKRLINGKVHYDLDADRRLSAVLTALDAPLGQDPGGLTLNEVRNDRRDAAPFALRLDAGQEVEQQRLGVIYTDRALAGGEFTGRLFLARRDFRQQLPFPGASLIAFDRGFYGVAVDYAGETAVADRPVRYTVGLDVEEQRDDRQRFSVDSGAEVTGQTQDERQEALATGVFLRTDTALTRRLELVLGARADRIRFRIDDHLGEDGDDSGTRRFDELSYLVGLGYQLTPDHRVYVNASSSFETPTFTEFAPQDNAGGFNPDLDPQRASNLEVGAKGFVGDSTRYELALFSVRTRDEIVNIQTDPNLYANVGRTRRHGVELAVEHFLTPSLSTSLAYTWSDFRIRGHGDTAGNRLPGLPRHAVFAELAWRTPTGAYAVLDGLLVSGVHADNANRVEVPGYGVMNARLGTVRGLGAGAEVEAFVGVNNLLDKEYFSNIRINARPDLPPAQRRYYEPAPGRNLYLGLRARF